MYTQTEKVNIEPKSYLPVFRISQNDIGRTLKAHLISDDGEITIPTSATVTMAGIKPSGLGYTVTGTINGSDVTFETDATMTDEAGQIESEIRIVDGETLIGTTNVILNIEPNPHPDDTTDGQREPLINEITALLRAIEEQAEQVADDARAVEQAMDAWTNMTAEATTLPAGSEASASYSDGELSLGIPAGPEGAPGQDGQDGVGIASVALNSDYTLTITLTDGRTYTTTSIRGEQGETGLTPDFSIGTVTTLAPGSQATATITGTDEEPVLNLGIPKGDPGEVSLETLAKVMVSDTASGTIATFSDGSDVLPAKSVLVTLEPKQSGSGTPSPSNIRPISGWDEVETHRAGVNLLPLVENNMISGGWNRGFPNPINQAGTYTISCENAFGGTGLGGASVAFANDAVYASPIGSLITTYAFGREVFTATFTVTEEQAKAPYIVFRCGSSGCTYASLENAHIQIELGSTATAYEPYDGQTITTTLPQTVYGGTLDVVNGTLTVDRVMVDLGSTTWTYNAIYYCWVTSAIADTVKKYPTQAEMITAIAEKYVVDPVGILNGTNFTVGKFILGTSGNLFVKTGSDSETPTGKFCYELSTPTTYTLPPQTINTLSGVNNVWVDSGDVTIEYYADTKLYIDKKLGGN